MQVVAGLADLREWCLKAKTGDEEAFSVAEEVTQEAASSFAFDVNQGREGHVWVSVGGTAFAPLPTTIIHVRCTT